MYIQSNSVWVIQWIRQHEGFMNMHSITKERYKYIRESYVFDYNDDNKENREK